MAEEVTLREVGNAILDADLAELAHEEFKYFCVDILIESKGLSFSPSFPFMTIQSFNLIIYPNR